MTDAEHARPKRFLVLTVGLPYSGKSTWCIEHLGQALPVVACKDYQMVRCYDDRCLQVVKNTGELVVDQLQGAIERLERAEQRVRAFVQKDYRCSCVYESGSWFPCRVCMLLHELSPENVDCACVPCAARENGLSWMDDL